MRSSAALFALVLFKMQPFAHRVPSLVVVNVCANGFKKLDSSVHTVVHL